MFIVDLEHVLKVSSPPAGLILCSHFCWARASGTGETAQLELGSLPASQLREHWLLSLIPIRGD